jgi:hypothetical protein
MFEPVRSEHAVPGNFRENIVKLNVFLQQYTKMIESIVNTFTSFRTSMHDLVEIGTDDGRKAL